MQPFNNISIYSYKASQALLHELKQIIDRTTCQTVDILNDLEELKSSADLLMVIGGDGSMISAITHAQLLDIPIIGINTGKLGFLTDLSIDELSHHVTQVINGEYQLEERKLISCFINDQWVGDCVNEVVLSRSSALNMIDFSLYINNSFLHQHRADGMIVATPTGSTAYALSAGGPIIHPQLQAILLQPICSHKVNSKPLLINVEDQIKMIYNPKKSSQAAVYLDGQMICELNEASEVMIKEAKRAFKLVHPVHYEFFQTLKTKLGWQ